MDLQNETTHVVVLFTESSSKQKPKQVDLVPRSWLKAVEDYWVCQYPMPEDYPKLDKWAKISKPPKPEWSCVKVRIIKEASNYDEGLRRLERSYINIRVDSSSATDDYNSEIKNTDNIEQPIILDDQTKNEELKKAPTVIINETVSDVSSEFDSSDQVLTDTAQEKSRINNTQSKLKKSTPRTPKVINNSQIIANSEYENLRINTTPKSTNLTPRKEEFIDSDQENSRINNTISKLKKSTPKTQKVINNSQIIANSEYENFRNNATPKSRNLKLREEEFIDSDSILTDSEHENLKNKNSTPKFKITKPKIRSSVRIVAADISDGEDSVYTKKRKRSSVLKRLTTRFESKLYKETSSESRDSSDEPEAGPFTKKIKTPSESRNDNRPQIFSKDSSDEPEAGPFTKKIKTPSESQKLTTRILSQQHRSTIESQDFASELDKKLKKIEDRIVAKIDSAKRSILYDIDKKIQEVKNTITVNSSTLGMNVVEQRKTLNIELPVRNLDSFIELESTLHTDPDKEKALKSIMTIVSGGASSTREAITNILKTIMGKTVQQAYSAYGRKIKGEGKKNFSITKIFSCMEDVICEKHDTSRDYILSITSRWLSGSGDREGGRANRTTIAVSQET